MGGTKVISGLRDRHALILVALLLGMTFTFVVADATTRLAAPSNPTLAIALSAIACASLTTTGVLTFRAREDGPQMPLIAACAGIALVGIGAIESTLRASGSGDHASYTVSFAVVAWAGRGLLTFGLASFERVAGVVTVGVAAFSFTCLGIVGVAAREGGNGLPSNLEQLAGGLLALILLTLSVRWLLNRERLGLTDSVGLVAAGVALALVLATATTSPGDGAELGSLAWLILSSALAAAWVDRQATERRRARDRVTFNALRDAEERRVLLETSALAQSIVRHDSRSSITAIEGGVHAIVQMHDQGDDERLLRMSAMVLAELGRVRRLLDGRADTSSSNLTAVLDPLLALHRASGLRITVDIDPVNVSIAMAADSLAQVLENVLRNCEIHAPGADVSIIGRVSVGGQRLLLTVSDNGPGVDPSIASTLFEPLKSTREEGGLGLHIVRSLVVRVGGTVELEPRFVGTAIRLDLPIDISSEPRHTPSQADRGAAPPLVNR